MEASVILEAFPETVREHNFVNCGLKKDARTIFQYWCPKGLTLQSVILHKNPQCHWFVTYSCNDITNIKDYSEIFKYVKPCDVNPLSTEWNSEGTISVFFRSAFCECQ